MLQKSNPLFVILLLSNACFKRLKALF